MYIHHEAILPQRFILYVYIWGLVVLNIVDWLVNLSNVASVGSHESRGL